MSKIGYGLSRQEIPDVVKNLLDRAVSEGYILPDDKRFVDNRPSKNWVYKFFIRHPSLAARTPENFGFRRTSVTEETIRNWFNTLADYLEQEHKIDAKTFFVEENSKRIFNIDESGFPLQGTNHRLKVVAMKGAKNVYRVAPDTKEQITVLACVSADGSFNKPLVVYPGARTPKFNFGGGVNPDHYGLGYSQNGWMTADVFFTWLSSIFFPEIKDSVPFPVILFLDGHTSHINLAVADFCVENDIILYCFPPHASHVLQPLDVSVFGPLKKEWNKSINFFRNQYGVAISRSHFFQIFDPAWKASTTLSNNVVSGFRSCGLVPFNVENVNFDKLLDVEAAKRHNTNAHVDLTPQQYVSHQKLGAVRTFQIIDKQLPEDMRKNFEKRFSEGYDLEDNTHKGILWKIYSNARKFTSSYSPAEMPVDEANNGQSSPLPNFELPKRSDEEVTTIPNENKQGTCTVASASAVTSEIPHADSVESEVINSAAKCRTQVDVPKEISEPTVPYSINVNLGDSERVSVVPDSSR